MFKPETFRTDRANELLALKDILTHSMPGIRSSVSKLSAAASKCRLSKANMWEYDVTNLTFPRILVRDSGVRHTKPRIEAYEVALTVSAFGVCTEEDSLSDPISDLNVDIVVTGYTKRHRKKINAIHLDSHPPRGLAERRSEPIPDLIRAYTTSGYRVNVAHPRYHFQIGGKQVLDRPSHEFGTQLLLETPRIAHPPLDAILAVDFVLSNYYSAVWTVINKEDSRYSELVKAAQETFWRPYLFAAASRWSPFSTAMPPWLPQQTYFFKEK